MDHFFVFLVTYSDKVHNVANLSEEIANFRNHFIFAFGISVGVKVAKEVQFVNSLEVIKGFGAFDVNRDFGVVLGNIVIQISFNSEHLSGNLTLFKRDIVLILVWVIFHLRNNQYLIESVK